MANASPREQALISALDKRYSGKTEHRTANDNAYAGAMREVYGRFPDDPDIAILYVESMMDLRPWGYWMPDGRPHEGTAEIVALTGLHGAFGMALSTPAGAGCDSAGSGTSG